MKLISKENDGTCRFDGQSVDYLSSSSSQTLNN